MQNIRNKITGKPHTLYMDLDNETQEIRIKLNTYTGDIFREVWNGFRIVVRINLDMIGINYGKYNR
jgi:hypothetical protein